MQIQQIIVNLLRNAIDASRAREMPEVRIASKSGGGGVEVSVADNGPGVPAEALPNLFRAFSSSKGDGLGLGLAISRTIAQTHGGDLTVDAGGVDRGACFTLHLPIPANGRL